MDLTLLIIIGVVILAAVGFFVMRKPKELPPKGDEGAKPKIEAKPEPKALAKAETKPAEPVKSKPPASGGAGAAGGGASPPAPSTKPKEVPAGKPPSDLQSSDVVTDDSVPPPPMPKAAEPSVAPPRMSKREIAGMRAGLLASRTGFIARLTSLFTGKKEIDPALLEQLEEVMLTSDVGVKTTQAILERLRDGLAKNELRDADAVWAALRAEATRLLTIEGGRSGRIQARRKPTVVLMVGVNGVGKTTTIGKLATRFGADGKKVIIAAGDTFRAAAVQQLEVWGKRVGAEVVRGKDGADPGAVAFEATTRAKEVGADVLLIDTAGRLHTKAPLMDEIKKVRKSIAKALDDAPHETLLVVDATTGNNALTQAAMFKEAIDLTGIILTKLDGTAKGGIVLAICDELKVPVRYIGLGERAEDLREFHAEDFVEALFGRETDEAAAA
jgi:fused signal recognition particle receptor